MSLAEKLVARMKPSVETMVAAGAALITGAAVYLMPVDLLQNAVIASGLPEVMPPLDPPLGGKARIGLALVAAGFAFGLVALLVRMLIGKPKAKVSSTARLFERKREAKAKTAEPAADSPLAPKLRRRDRHPDAPARAPLSIGREIGVPGSAPPPSFAKEEPVFAPEPAVEREPEFVPVAEEPAIETPVWAEPEPAAVEPEPVATHPAWLDAEVPQPSEGREPSLAELLERLEAAMARRVPVVPVPEQSPVAVEPVAQADEAGDDRLRSALESLKRFAPGRG